MAWLLLVVAGLFEVAWATGMKYTEGWTRAVPTMMTLTAMGVSIVFLERAVRTIPVGTGYAVWTGIGVVGTAILGVVLFHEPLNASRVLFLLMIVGGIVGLRLAS